MSPLDSPPATRRRLPGPATTLILLGLAGCAAAEDLLSPDNTPAGVTVLSPTDSVLAVGFNVQLSATAAARDGTPVSGATFTWASSNAAVASVSASGLVSVATGGQTTITATSAPASGSWTLRAVDSDVAAVNQLIADPFVVGLAAQVSQATASAIAAQLTACGGGLVGGDLIPVHTCLTALRTVAGDGSGTDSAVIAVLELFWDHAVTLLNFGR